MIRDAEMTFSKDQAVTASAASTNILDLGPPNAAGYSLGNFQGRRLPIGARVTEAFTASGAGTMTVSVRSSASSDMSNPVTHFSTAAIGKATLVSGYVIPGLEIPPDALRYVDLYYTVATGPMTAGKVTAIGETDFQRSYNAKV